MTWPDVVFILAVVIFLAMGARLGSVWTVACLAAGFAGAYVADLYALPLAGYLPSVPGAPGVVAVLLFLAAAFVVLLPGWLLSKIVKGVFLGVADGIVGFLAGGIVALLGTALLLLALVPSFPAIERSKAWKNSRLVRPYHAFVESGFSEAPVPALRAVEDVTEAAEEAGERLRKRVTR